MTPRRLIVLTLLILGLLLAGFSGRPEHVATAHDEAVDGAQEPARSNDSAADAGLGREVASSKLDAARQRPRSDAAAIPRRLSYEHDREEASGTQQSLTELDAEAASEIDTEFFAEAVGIKEGRQAQEDIAAVLGTLTLAAELLDVRCTSSRCRVLLWHATESEQLATVDHVRDAAPAIDALYRNTSYTGEPTTILYVSTTQSEHLAASQISNPYFTAEKRNIR